MIQKKNFAGFQRAWLRKNAHHLKPVVNIGQIGVSDAIEKSIIEALAHHELIKVKFYGLKDERKEACAHIAQVCSAELVGIIGNIGIFYRQASKPEDRQYHIPIRKTAPSGAVSLDDNRNE